MPRFGAHVSTAGGIGKSVRRARRLNCECFQIFSRNQRQWSPPPLEKEEIGSFVESVESSGLRPVISHASYLINLASTKTRVLQRSVLALSDEIGRCSQLQIPYLVLHPGSHGGEGVEKGISKIAEGLIEGLTGYEEKEIKENLPPMILLENTAGQGTSIGHDLLHLKEIEDLVFGNVRTGICIDTCHLFGAGYDLRSVKQYEETMDLIDDLLSLEAVKVIHLNDSKRPLGSNVDRHENIGEGEIGTEGFRLLVTDRRNSEKAMILETPGGERYYKKNLEVLRSML